MNADVVSGTGVTVDAEELIALRAYILRNQAVHSPASSLPGGFAITRRGNGQVIADSRVYIHGDDLRHVDRGATARTGDLYVRTFHEERDRVTFLVADFRPSMLWGMRRAFRSVAAAQALALIGWQAVETGGRVGLLAITAEERVLVVSRPRASGMLAVIGGLVRAHAQALKEAAQGAKDGDLADALDGLHRIVPRGAEIIVASALDHRGAEFEATLGVLSRHRSLRFLVVEDKALTELPAGHYPLRSASGDKVRAFFHRRTAAAKPSTDGLEAYQINYLDAGQPVQDWVS